MKKQIFQVSFHILSLILTVLLLTGCSPDSSDIRTNPSAEETETSVPDTEISPSEKTQPASFSHAEPQAPADTDYVFPETAFFIDDTGNSIQRGSENCLYFYHGGRLMRFHPESGEITLLYQTASTHRISFCLFQNNIYFVERTGYDSLDDRDTSLYRIEKDGRNLTLLQDDIVNAGTIKDWNEYSIDIYDDIIYLLNYTSGYENGNYVTRTANLYYRLENDGSVSEIEETETLYGMLPRRFSPICDSDFPSFPYAMRNYGYLFVQDAQQMLYRLNPVNGYRESLGLNKKAISGVTFSGDTIFLHPDYNNAPALYELSEKALFSLEDPFWENASLLVAFPIEEGFYYCARSFDEDSVSGETVYRFFLRRLMTDGFVNTLIHNASDTPFGENVYYSNLKNTSCLLGDRIYYFKEEEMQHHLMSFHIQNISDLQTLHTWSPYPTASPAAVLSEKKSKETEIDGKISISCFVNKLYLEEQTYSDTLINQTLREVYTDFEDYVNDLIQDEREQIEAEPKFYESFNYISGYDFSLHTFLDYMDDDTISFCCSYYQYYAYAAHGYYWSDYYVFDRHTGERLSFEDFAGNSTVILDIATPYVEKMAEWDFESEMLLEQSRFSLSEDGYTLYFAPYDIACYAAGDFLISIPYDAFEKKL